jgi:hypothetical protein
MKRQLWGIQVSETLIAAVLVDLPLRAVCRHHSLRESLTRILGRAWTPASLQVHCGPSDVPGASADQSV